jgi:hypothetical protein
MEMKCVLCEEGAQFVNTSPILMNFMHEFGPSIDTSRLLCCQLQTSLAFFTLHRFTFDADKDHKSSTRGRQSLHSFWIEQHWVSGDECRIYEHGESWVLILTWVRCPAGFQRQITSEAQREPPPPSPWSITIHRQTERETDTGTGFQKI